MRVLLDECVPRQLKPLLSGHQVSTIFEAGWAGEKNGALLRMANESFDVLVTADKAMYHQQNFDGLEITVIVLPTNNIRRVREVAPALLQTLDRVEPGQRIVMDFGTIKEHWPELNLRSVVSEDPITRHVFDFSKVD